MFCINLRVSILLFIILTCMLYFNNRDKHRIHETFSILAINPLFILPSLIKSGVYDKYQAIRTSDGYKISPDNAHNFNKLYGFGEREYDFYGKRNYSNLSWREVQREKDARKRDEKLDVLELVPLIWQFQDRLFVEYRKYFDKVECLKHYFNILKTSRNTPKQDVMEWHKDNCDITLDLNYELNKGDKQYVGLDGINAKMKISDTGK